MTFDVIGVGTAELMFYLYWCLAKGYGRAVGPQEDSKRRADRAKGWIRVLQLDAWASMIVYTTVTHVTFVVGLHELYPVGWDQVDETVVIRVSGMVERHDDQWIAPTTVFL